MKNKILSLTVLALIAIGIVIVLYYHSVDDGNTFKNGFTRNFKINKIHLRRTCELGFNSYYIAGISKANLYLGNYVNTSHLLVVDRGNLDTSQVNIKLPSNDSIAWAGVEVTVDSPNVYASDFLRASFFSGNVRDFVLTRLPFDSRNADAVKFISPSSFVTRSFNKLHKQSDLFKVLNGKTINPNKSPLISAQEDGIFSTDGILTYNDQSALIVYAYYYRNQYICLDTNLNVKIAANTIDTISYAQVQIANIKSSNSQTLIGRPNIINTKCALSDRELYILSTRRADNQSNQLDQSVIDCYDVFSGQYLNSFYLPMAPRSLKSFMIRDDHLFVISDRRLMVYLLLD